MVNSNHLTPGTLGSFEQIDQGGHQSCDDLPLAKISISIVDTY